VEATVRKTGTWRTTNAWRLLTRSGKSVCATIRNIRVRMPTPPETAIAPAEAATIFDGTNYIVLTAHWRGGLWPFVE
jgi:hypothetical protein